MTRYITACLFAALLAAAPTTEARLRSGSNNRNSNNNDNPRKLNPYHKGARKPSRADPWRAMLMHQQAEESPPSSGVALELEEGPSGDAGNDPHGKEETLILIGAEQIDASMEANLSAEEVAQIHFYEEEMIQAQMLEDQARYEQELLDVEATLAEKSATQAQKDKVLRQEKLAKAVLEDALEQEHEARTEYTSEIRRKLEIKTDGMVFFNGKYYEPDQITFEVDDYSTDGAIEEDRPDDEDDVETVRSATVHAIVL